jgi:hypothetical protein
MNLRVEPGPPGDIVGMIASRQMPFPVEPKAGGALHVGFGEHTHPDRQPPAVTRIGSDIAEAFPQRNPGTRADDDQEKTRRRSDRALITSGW